MPSNGTLWFGSSRGFAPVGGNGGSLYRIRLTADRLHVDTSADPRLADKVADNLFRAQKFEGTESESLLIGKGFGTTPSIEQGPDGNLYVVSITDGAVYRISRAPGADHLAGILTEAPESQSDRHDPLLDRPAHQLGGAVQAQRLHHR